MSLPFKILMVVCLGFIQGKTTVGQADVQTLPRPIDSLIGVVLSEKTESIYTRRTMPQALKDSCDHLLKFPVTGSYGKEKWKDAEIQNAYSTSSFYVIQYTVDIPRTKRKGTEMMVLDKQMKPLARYYLYDWPKSVDELVSLLEKKKYFEWSHLVLPKTVTIGVLDSVAVLRPIDLLIASVLTDKNQAFYTKRTIPEALKDTCLHLWKVNKAQWFRSGISITLIPNNPKHDRRVRFVFSTDGYYIVQYFYCEGLGIGSLLLVFDKNLHLLETLQLHFHPDSKEELLTGLKGRNYRKRDYPVYRNF